MTFQLTDLPSSLFLKVVQKLEPVQYIRIRCCCRSVDFLCEEARRSIRVQLRNPLRLYLLDSYKRLCSFQKNANENLEGIWACIDYGREKWETSLKLRMTRKNITVLRAAISGFYFSEVVVWNCKHHATPELLLKFDKAANFFREAVRGVKYNAFTGRNLTSEQFQAFTDQNRIDALTISAPSFGVIERRMAKGPAEEIFLHWTMTPRESLDVYELCLNKKRVNLDLSDVKRTVDSTVDFWNTLEQLLKAWKTRSSRMVEGLFTFNDQPSFHSQDLSAEGSMFHKLGAVHLGSYRKRNIDVIQGISGGIYSYGVIYDLFLIHSDGPDQRALFVKINRMIYSADCYTVMFVWDLTQQDMDLSLHWVTNFSVILYKAPLDLSTPFEDVAAETTVEGKKKRLDSFLQDMVEHYKRREELFIDTSMEN